MITTGDMANIVAKKCSELGIKPVMQGDNIPLEGEIDSERVVVIPKAETQGRIWNKTTIEVNILTPNLRNGIVNSKRLNEIERLARSVFRNTTTGLHDGTAYRFSYNSIGRISSTSLRCGWINAKIQFETLNTKNNE